MYKYHGKRYDKYENEYDNSHYITNFGRAPVVFRRQGRSSSSLNRKRIRRSRLRSSGSMQSMRKALQKKTVVDNFEMASGFEDEEYADDGGASLPKKHVVRSHFPETWLFQLKPVDSRGKAVVSLKAPDTLTSWTGEAVCMSSKAGIGLAKPASILVKKVSWKK